MPYKGIKVATIVNREDRGLAQHSPEIGIVASLFPGYGYESSGSFETDPSVKTRWGLIIIDARCNLRRSLKFDS